MTSIMLTESFRLVADAGIERGMMIATKRPDGIYTSIAVAPEEFPQLVESARKHFIGEKIFARFIRIDRVEGEAAADPQRLWFPKGNGQFPTRARR